MGLREAVRRAISENTSELKASIMTSMGMNIWRRGWRSNIAITCITKSLKVKLRLKYQ